MRAKDRLGRVGEQRAAAYLNERGYEILDRNWRGPCGELDIIAARGKELAIVEVKTRSTIVFGDPLEAVDEAKLNRMWRLGKLWAGSHREASRGRTLTLHVVGIVTAGAGAGIRHLADIR